MPIDGSVTGQTESLDGAKLDDGDMSVGDSRAIGVKIRK